MRPQRARHPLSQCAAKMAAPHGRVRPQDTPHLTDDDHYAALADDDLRAVLVVHVHALAVGGVLHSPAPRPVCRKGERARDAVGREVEGGVLFHGDVRGVVRAIHEVDGNAFINTQRTDSLIGRFYRTPQR